MGLDSLMALELRVRLRASLGVSLGPTAAFDHPTLDRLTRAIVRELFGEEKSADPPPADDVLERAARLDDEAAAQRIDEILADFES